MVYTTWLRALLKRPTLVAADKSTNLSVLSFIWFLSAYTGHHPSPMPFLKILWWKSETYWTCLQSRR